MQSFIIASEVISINFATFAFSHELPGRQLKNTL
jgi:hypothetical protein